MRPLKHTTSLPGVRSSILQRTIRHSLAVTVTTVLVLLCLSFLIARAFLEQRVLLQVASFASSREDSLEELVRTNRERTSLIAASADMNSLLLDTSGTSLRALLQRLSREGVAVEEGAVLRADGSVISSTEGFAELPIVSVPPSPLVPVLDATGWKSLMVVSRSVNAAGTVRGYLVLSYDVRFALRELLDASSLGKTGEVQLAMPSGEEIILVHHKLAVSEGKPLELGALKDLLAQSSLAAQAVNGTEQVLRTEDDAGNDVFAASRALPVLGWGLIAKVNAAEALHGVLLLAISFVSIGLLLIALASLFAVALARKLTGPLKDLTQKVQKLTPGKWKFARTVRTQDEVEVLDAAVADLTQRLQRVYDHLEEEVADRTEELKRQYAKDRTILRTIRHGIVVCDAKGIITDANDAATALLMQKSGELLGTNAVNALPMVQHQRTLTLQKHPLSACMKRRKEVRSTPDARFSILRQDGTLLPVSLIATPLLQGKSLIGAILVFQDMTEDRRVDYLKSEFISLASHQLRTPLSSLQWYIELLGSEGKHLSKEHKEYIREMSRASHRMSELIDSLLRVAKLEGGVKPEKQTFSMKKLAEEMGEEFRSLAKEKKISCLVELPTEDVLVQSDTVLLHIVFKNLMSNAVKYTRAGGKVGLRMTNAKGGCQVEVWDTGIGIPKEEQTRIFEKLFRAKNVRIMDTDGNGLGLYISKMIMQNLGGSLRFESKESKGTSFIFSLSVGKKGEK